MVVSCQKTDDESRPYEFGFTIDGEQHRHEKKGAYKNPIRINQNLTRHFINLKLHEFQTLMGLFKENLVLSQPMASIT